VWYSVEREYFCVSLDCKAWCSINGKVLRLIKDERNIVIRFQAMDETVVLTNMTLFLVICIEYFVAERVGSTVNKVLAGVSIVGIAGVNSANMFTKTK